MGGLPASVAGLPAAQTKGSEVDRGPQELAAGNDRRTMHKKRPMRPTSAKPTAKTTKRAIAMPTAGSPGRQPPEPGRKADQPPPNSRDATGQSGNLLDLTG